MPRLYTLLYCSCYSHRNNNVTYCKYYPWTNSVVFVSNERTVDKIRTYVIRNILQSDTVSVIVSVCPCDFNHTSINYMYTVLSILRTAYTVWFILCVVQNILYILHDFYCKIVTVYCIIYTVWLVFADSLEFIRVKLSTSTLPFVTYVQYGVPIMLISDTMINISDDFKNWITI